MELFLEFINTILYFLCVKNIGEFFLCYKRKFLKNTYVYLIAVSIVMAMIMLYANVWVKLIAHIISVVMVSDMFFKESFKNILGLYLGTTAVISIVSDLFYVAVTQFVGFLKLDVLDGLIRIFDLFLVLLCIWMTGKYFHERYRNGLRTIGIKYWVLFISMMLFDAFIIAALGDFIVNIMQVWKKDLIVFLYCGVVIGLLIQLLLLINTLVTRNVHKENEELAKQFLESQKKHYQYLEKREHETKKFRHDIKNHLMLLENLIATQKYEEAREYLNTISEKVTSFSNQISVNNGIADAILNRFYMEAEEQGIVLKVKGHFPVNCNISAYDICTILSNVLSNAIQAEREAGGDEVLVNIRYTENEVLLSVENDYAHKLEEVGGVYRTTKKDNVGHGYGLSGVKDCVERNGGTLSISTENQRFKILIMIMKGHEKKEG